MIYLGFVLATTAGTLGLMILWRLHVARKNLQRLPIGVKLLRLRLDTWLDDDLLASSGPGGFSDIDVTFREPQDDFATAGDLLRMIAKLAGAESSTDILKLIVYMYHLQYTIKIPVGDFEGIINGVADRLPSLSHSGSPIKKVKIVREGDTVDPKYHWSLNPGTRVRQPFGVVLQDESGTVLNKAKVLCR